MTVGDVGNRSREIYTRIWEAEKRRWVRGFDLFSPPLLSFHLGLGKRQRKTKRLPVLLGLGAQDFASLAIRENHTRKGEKERKEKEPFVSLSFFLSRIESESLFFT